MNAVNQLRKHLLNKSTQGFKARGSKQERCDCCSQAKTYCLCPWRLTLESSLDFVLLMHPKEPYKASNTGRLIAELLPDNTEAFIWSRTELPPRFFDIINDPKRHCALLYPPDNSQATAAGAIVDNTKKTTVIILDGTWKQAARMANLSPYLQAIPRIDLSIPEQKRGDYLRKATSAIQLSTAEALACLLDNINEKDNSLALEHYATLLNHHTRSARNNQSLQLTESHHYLNQRLNATN